MNSDDEIDGDEYDQNRYKEDLRKEIKNIKSINKIRKEYVERTVNPTPNQAHIDDATFRFERRISPRKPLFVGTGLGVKSKIIRHGSQAASDTELQANLFAITDRGFEITPSVITPYKWRTIEFITKININILCMLEITDSLMNISSKHSIVDYLIFLVDYTSAMIKNSNVFDKAFKNFINNVNKILIYHFDDDLRSLERYKPNDNGVILNFQRQYDTMYENVFAFYVNSFRDTSINSSVNINTDQIDESCTRLFDALLLSYRNTRSIHTNRINAIVRGNNIANWIYGKCDFIRSQYRPIVELQVFKVTTINVNKFNKIRKNEIMPIDSDDESDIVRDEHTAFFGSGIDAWRSELVAINDYFARWDTDTVRTTREQITNQHRRGIPSRSAQRDRQSRTRYVRRPYTGNMSSHRTTSMDDIRSRSPSPPSTSRHVSREPVEMQHLMPSTFYPRPINPSEEQQSFGNSNPIGDNFSNSLLSNRELDEISNLPI